MSHRYDPTAGIAGRSGTVVVLAVTLLVVLPAEATATPDALPETPVEYERRALREDPTLESIVEKWRAARREARAERSKWPQPTLSYRTFLDGWWLDQPGLRHRGILSQTFPWPGVLDAAGDPARKRAEALEHEFQARALEVLFEMRRALVEVARVDAERGILEEQRDVYGDVASVVRQNMETGDANYGDFLRINTTRETIVDRLDALETEREERVAEVRELVGAGSDRELTFDFDGSPLELEPASLELESLVEAARNNHPTLAAQRDRADARRERAEYASLRRYPWPTVMLGVDSIPNRMSGTTYDRRTALMLHVSVPIPIFGAQYDHESSKFEREGDALLADRRGTVRRLTSEIEQAVAQIGEKRRRLKRYREELMPLAEDASEHMLQKIETGEKRITDYLLSIQQQLDLETNVVEFRATIAIERARLQKLTGGTFEAFPDRETPELDIQQLQTERDSDE